MYYCYIIYSKSINRFYIGATSQLEERIKKHNTNHKGYTGKSNDWKLVYKEEFTILEEAYQRERQIKKWKSRSKIEMLIKNTK